MYLGALLTNKCEDKKVVQMRLMKADKYTGIIYPLLRSKHKSQR